MAGPVNASGFVLYSLGQDAGTSGGPGVSQIILADAHGLTPEQFAQQQCGICPAHPFEDTTLGGQPARHTIIGGGSAPGSKLPTRLVAIERPGLSAASLLAGLRRLPTPVIARIDNDRVVLDLRTVLDEQDVLLAELLATL